LDIIEEDTIIIKLDVEGAECKVLSNYLNSDEHKEIIISLIGQVTEKIQSEDNCKNISITRLPV